MTKVTVVVEDVPASETYPAGIRVNVIGVHNDFDEIGSVTPAAQLCKDLNVTIAQRISIPSAALIQQRADAAAAAAADAARQAAADAAAAAATSGQPTQAASGS